MFALLAGLALAVPDLPPIRRDPQITYVDRSGAVIGVRGGRYAPPIDIARLPPYVPAAFVSIEDRRFYSHSGFDPVGMARALMSDLGGGSVQGGSTITQQLARNLYLNADRTMERKGQELVLATQLEQKYSKSQILGLYLSRIYFGSGAYGIEAASERYFNKPAARLTLMEAAMLAALPKSPTDYNPAEQPQRSATRAALVLDAMVDTGAISSAERSRALAHPPHVWKDAPTAPAQYFVDWMDAATHKTIGAVKQDLIVQTTLDMPAETAADEAAHSVVARFAGARVGQAALVALDGAGRVRAMIGGVDYGASPFNRAIDAHRQAGSAWKPFVYLTALEAGRTPDTLVVDEPVTINGWSPRNFEPEYLGSITLQTALAHSINTVAARLADEVGRPAIAANARNLGILTPISTDPAMALGASAVTPLQMAQAYDAFSNGGQRVAAYGIESIRTTGGAVVWQRKPTPLAQAIPNPPLSELDGMLREVIRSGTGTRAAVPGHDVAGKTGTTSDFKDAWFCGFTGGLTTVVWVGRDDGTPMRGITGGSAPAEFWRGFMTAALRRLPNGPIPYGPAPAAAVTQTVATTTPPPILSPEEGDSPAVEAPSNARQTPPGASPESSSPLPGDPPY